MDAFPRLIRVACLLLAATATSAGLVASGQAPEVRGWIDQVEIPTYLLGEADPNPHFRAIEGSRIYPYPMQDRFTDRRATRTYKAVWLENEYLRVLCLPELGGRIQSVFDKVANREMFYRNQVIRPGHIALRGAWVSGGIEWNHGPEGHGVTSFSPVDVRLARGADGSASLLIGNIEQVHRTGWQVRLTLRPGRRQLDEQILLYNPTDGLHPYYFWNNTAFPERPGTRFIFPMTLGTDHDGTSFFSWPEHEGRDMTWLRNYPEPTSVFGYEVDQDFFGAYDVDARYGIVQVADHRLLPGKKAWTWGQADQGRVAQSVLTDEDGPYIEVQSGPLRTQSDFAMLMPGQEIAWQEYWSPVSDLAYGFEYATRHAAIERLPADGGVELRIAATGTYPDATLEVERRDGRVLRETLDLSPARTEVVRVARGPVVDPETMRLRIRLRSARGETLLDYFSPLEPTPRRQPDPEPPVAPTVETTVLAGWEHDLRGDRLAAMEAYRAALELDPGHTDALRWLAADELERGRPGPALELLERALNREARDGWTRYLEGVARLRTSDLDGAEDAGFAAVRQPDTVALGWSIVGRARARRGDPAGAAEAFTRGLSAGGADWTRLFDSVLVATWAAGDQATATAAARQATTSGSLRLVPHLVPALSDQEALDQVSAAARRWLGEPDFAFVEAALFLDALGLTAAAANVVEAGNVRAVAPGAPRPESLWYLAWLRARAGDEAAANQWLDRAATAEGSAVFPSRHEAVAVLDWVVATRPDDARAHEARGNLLAGLDRVDEAVDAWREAARLDATRSIARRNLGAWEWRVRGDLDAAERWFRDALAARPDDQTLPRDLARVLRASDHTDEAIALLESLLPDTARRADVTLELADAYLAAGRPGDTLALLAATRFVNREGDASPWELFHRAHLELGSAALADDPAAALRSFEAALTYPDNLNAGRPHRPREARAWLGKGRALEALGRTDEAAEALARCAALAPLDEEQRRAIAACERALEGSTDRP